MSRIVRVPTLRSVAAENLRGFRARRRMRQADLGEALNIAARTVSTIEAGDRELTLSELPVVCRALGVTLEQLLDGADEADLRALGL